MATLISRLAQRFQQENGSILLIVLVLMMVLATIGLQSMSSTSLQERMTGNSMDENISFQSAEAAMRAAESWIESQAGHPTAVSTCSSPPCQVWTQGSISYSSYYVNSSWWSTNARPYNSASSTTPYYIIEERIDTASSTTTTGQSQKTGTGGLSSSGSTTYFYRITARGAGNSGSSVIVLQSTYAKAF